MTDWTFYLIRTRHGTLYAGITTDMVRRFEEHQAGGKGSKYLRSKGPLQLVYQVKIGEHALALKTEYRVKSLRKLKKETLVKQQFEAVELLNYLNMKRSEQTLQK